jgi:hypothetical protein
MTFAGNDLSAAAVEVGRARIDGVGRGAGDGGMGGGAG